MDASIRVAIGVLLAALIVASGVHAQAEEPVRVYTNADLDLLAPMPSDRGPSGPDAAQRSSDAESWKFVAEFIERELARIDADRDYDLDRERVENEAEEDRGYGIPYLGYYGFYRGPYPYGVHHGPGRARHPERSHLPRFRLPHKMFRDRPPVREHVPGLGNSYRRGPVRHAHGRYKASR